MAHAKENGSQRIHAEDKRTVKSVVPGMKASYANKQRIKAI